MGCRTGLIWLRAELRGRMLMIVVMTRGLYKAGNVFGHKQFVNKVAAAAVYKFRVIVLNKTGNIETRNHCYRGKAISVTYSVCVCL